jgi:hypothetical protein
MGPQAMEGDLKVSPGTTLKAGYDFTAPGNHSSFSVAVGSPQVVFAVKCVSGATPSASTLTVPMPDATYSVVDDKWCERSAELAIGDHWNSRRVIGFAGWR